MPSFVLNSYSYLQQRNLNLQHRTLPSKVHLSFDGLHSSLYLQHWSKWEKEGKEPFQICLSNMLALDIQALTESYIPGRWNCNLHLQVKYKELTRP